jgi:hypothetical protein
MDFVGEEKQDGDFLVVAVDQTPAWVKKLVE